MKNKKIYIVGITCFVISIYLTLLLLKYEVFEGLTQGSFIFIYWMILLNVLAIWMRGKIEFLEGKKGVYIISVIFAFITLWFLGDSILLRFQQNTSIEIIATGEKNETALAAEVWLTQIEVDGTILDLNTIVPEKGWYFKNALVSYPSEKECIQKIQIGKAENIRLSFVKHAWSGIVYVKVAESVYEIDLYDVDSTIHICELSGTMYQNRLLDILSILIVFYVLFYIWLIVCLLCRKSIIWELFKKNIFWYQEKSKTNKIFMWVVATIVSFQFVGAEWFLIDKSYTVINIFKFVGSVICFMPVLVFFLRCLEFCEEYLFKRHKEEKSFEGMKCGTKIFILVFSIVLSIPLVVSIKEIFFHEEIVENILIVPTGEKNEKSYGTEVLLSGITVNGTSYMLSSFEQLPDGWSNEGGMLFGRGTTPLNIEISEPGDVCIYFNKHQWSGIVEIIDGNKVERFDLYADEESSSYIMSYSVTGSKINKNIWKEVVVTLLLEVCSIAILYCMFTNIQKVWFGDRKCSTFFWSIFCIELLIFLFYILASYPASICIDGRTQLYQAIGINELSDAHPAFHTLLIKLITINGEFLVFFPIIQAICICSLSAFILNYLYKRGCNRKFLLLFACCQALSINNGIYVTTIWKDVMYSYCLLWLTYLLLCLQENKNYINNKWNVLIVAIVLGLVRLLRHNGIVVLIGVGVALVVWSFTRKKWTYIVSLLMSVLFIFGVRNGIYPMLGVESVNASTGFFSLVHGIVYASISGDVPDETKEFLEDIMPLEKWSQCYSKYSANDLGMSTISQSYQVSEKLKDIGTFRIIQEYGRVFVHSPMRLIEDRLFGIDILWNSTRDNGYNWRVANDIYEIGIVSNEQGWYRKDNIFTRMVEDIYRISTENQILDSLFWRAGIWVACLLVVICYGVIKRKYRVGYYLPVVLNILSLCLAMAWQDFRYVYFVNLCVPYIVLMCMSIQEEKNNEYNMI